MLIYPPLPNELDRSYMGRLMRLNGVGNEVKFIKMLAQHLGISGKSRRKVSYLELLIRSAQIEIQTFIMLHTTIPFRRGITVYHPNIKHGSEKNWEKPRSTGVRVARPGAYYCAECVRIDEAKYGTSYWHRDHQMPGLLWCPEHMIPLKYMADKKAYLMAPDQIFSMCDSVSAGLVISTIDNRFINTFLAISFALLEFEKPFHSRHVAVIISNKAGGRFKTYSGNHYAPLLSDAIVVKFGREWLSTFMPTLANKKEGASLSQIDGVVSRCTITASVSAYVLMLSFLFETPEMALNALIRSEMA